MMTNNLEALDQETVILSSPFAMRECQSYPCADSGGRGDVPNLIDTLPGNPLTIAPG